MYFKGAYLITSQGAYKFDYWLYNIYVGQGLIKSLDKNWKIDDPVKINNNALY